MTKLLQIQGITKSFPGVLALDDVNLELNAGEVLALLGENGAGKSTLLKILAGVYIPDAGEIYIDGEKQRFKRPVDAYRAGISVIYQELNYYNDLSVAENIFVGRLPKNSPFSVDWSKLYSDAKLILDKLGVPIDACAMVSDLSIAEKQLVEIARALSFENMRILVMDEPTATLNDSETDTLLKLVRKLAAQGLGIIFISHRLNELFTVADRVQILRDGRHIIDLPMKEVTQTELVRHMVGREISDMYPKVSLPIGKVRLQVNRLTSHVLKDISFEVRAGEILGVFGLMGSGRTEMCRAIFGASKLLSGTIFVDGEPVRIQSPRMAMQAGIAYVPNERKSEGLILEHSVETNLTTAVIKKFTRLGGLVLNSKKETDNAVKWIENLSISTPNAQAQVVSLSGGNQQKVVLGKWLETEPKVIILNEPTRGIDVNAKTEIYKIMEQLCEQGMAVIMVSSEQTEILALTDRAIVLYEGRLSGELSRENYTPEKLMHYAIGGEN